MNQLHTGAKWIFRLNAYSRFGGLFFVLIYFFLFTSFSGDTLRESLFGNVLGFSFFIGVVLFILFVLIVGEIYSRMAYARWFYEITNDGVKIEHGIIWKRYTSVPYERVQNVDIKRGIIARMFGFSTVEIETAGQSGSGIQYGRRGYKRYKSEGHLPAIDVVGAEKIREFVMKKIKRKQEDSGL